MSEWKEYKLGDIAEILDFKRKPLSSMERSTRKGIYPYYGASGIIDNIDDFIFEGEHVLISEDGENLRTRQTPIAFLANGKFWVNNHTHIVKSDSVHNRLICYYFAQLDLNPYITGAVQPKLSQDSLNKIPIYLPTSIDERKRIVGVLSSLDDKIDLLNRENATLEALAETLFRHYFIENPNPDWKEGKLGDVCHYVTDKMETSSLTTISYISTENMLNDKQGVTEASSIPNDIRVTRYGVGDILLSNIRPYFKKIWLADRKGGCSNDVLCIRANEKEFDCFVYYTLRQDDFFDYVMLGSKGCKMPRGDKQHIMNWPICLPNVESLGVFNKSVYLMIQKIKSNQQQIQTLTTKRDTLLPRLMSGEVNVVAH